MTLEALERVRERNESLARQADPIRTNRRARDTGEGPTPEWQAKTPHEAPQKDQQTDRKNHRRMSNWTMEFRKRNSPFEAHHVETCERFHAYWHAREGHDMRRVSDGVSFDSDLPFCEFAGNMLHLAKSVVGHEQIWQTLELFVIHEKSLEDIGKMFRPTIRDDKILRAHGAAVILLGLNPVADMWGLGPRQRSIDRKAA